MSKYWTIREAAEAWGVSYSTARRYAKRLRGDSRRRLPAGTPPPEVKRGNPHFRNPKKQAEYAAKRWPLTMQQKMAIDVIIHEPEDTSFDRAVEFAKRMLHV